MRGLSTPKLALKRFRELDELTIVCALENGATTDTTPPALDEWADHVMSVTEGLAKFAPHNQALIIAAFVESLESGFARSTAEMLDGRSSWVEAFDTREAWGCVVVVMSPDEQAQAPEAAETNRLPTRYGTSRLGPTGRCLGIDDGYTQMLGYDPDDIVDTDTAWLLHPDDAKASLLDMADLLRRPGGQSRCRQRMRHKLGHWVWIEVTRTNLLHTSEPHVRCEAFDLTAERAAQDALQRREALLERLTETLPLGVLHLSVDGRLDLKNGRWAEITGVEPVGDLTDIITATFENPQDIRAQLNADEANDTPSSVHVRFRSDDPEARWRTGLLSRYPVRAADGLETGPASDQRVLGHLVTLDDVTDMMNLQRELSRSARIDHLTQALNRLGLEEAIAKLLNDRTPTADPDASDGSGEKPIQILYFDINNFKQVNDELGHAAGDATLVAVTEAIRLMLRPEDLVGRLGGDEFVAVLYDVAADDAREVARRIQARCQAVAGSSVAVGLTSRQPGDDFDALVSRADRDMYRDKNARPGASVEALHGS